MCCVEGIGRCGDILGYLAPHIAAFKGDREDITADALHRRVVEFENEKIQNRKTSEPGHD